MDCDGAVSEEVEETGIRLTVFHVGRFLDCASYQLHHLAQVSTEPTDQDSCNTGDD